MNLIQPAKNCHSLDNLTMHQNATCNLCKLTLRTCSYHVKNIQTIATVLCFTSTTTSHHFGHEFMTYSRFR